MRDSEEGFNRLVMFIQSEHDDAVRAIADRERANLTEADSYYRHQNESSIRLWEQRRVALAEVLRQAAYVKRTY